MFLRLTNESGGSCLIEHTAVVSIEKGTTCNTLVRGVNHMTWSVLQAELLVARAVAAAKDLERNGYYGLGVLDARDDFELEKHTKSLKGLS